MKTRLDDLNHLLQKLDPEHLEMAVKALPILLPYLIDYHTPRLEFFLQPGTNFTLGMNSAMNVGKSSTAYYSSLYLWPSWGIDPLGD